MGELSQHQTGKLDRLARMVRNQRHGVDRMLAICSSIIKDQEEIGRNLPVTYPQDGEMGYDGKQVYYKPGWDKGRRGS